MIRSIAAHSVDELGGPISVLARQQRDHIALDALLEELISCPPHGQPQVLTRIYRLVFPHAFAEESVLWPVLRRALRDGHELTLKVEQEHQEINELVTHLEELAVDDPGRQPLLDRLVALLREDVRDEEDELLPRLQEATTTRRLRRLGVYWEIVRRTAPTRPHPVVARRPPGNVLAAIPLSLLDRARDVVDDATNQVPHRTAPALHAVSRTLAHATRRIERLPLLRSGEDPSTRSDVS